MKQPYWIFSWLKNGWFLLESKDGLNWCDIPPWGGTSNEYPQQRSIGHFLKFSAEHGWLNNPSIRRSGRSGRMINDEKDEKETN